MTYRFN